MGCIAYGVCVHDLHGKPLDWMACTLPLAIPNRSRARFPLPVFRFPPDFRSRTRRLGRFHTRILPFSFAHRTSHSLTHTLVRFEIRLPPCPALFIHYAVDYYLGRRWRRGAAWFSFSAGPFDVCWMHIAYKCTATGKLVPFPLICTGSGAHPLIVNILSMGCMGTVDGLFFRLFPSPLDVHEFHEFAGGRDTR